jgi:hypothetical protein
LILGDRRVVADVMMQQRRVARTIACSKHGVLGRCFTHGLGLGVGSGSYNCNSNRRRDKKIPCRVLRDRAKRLEVVLGAGAAIAS